MQLQLFFNLVQIEERLAAVLPDPSIPTPAIAKGTITVKDRSNSYYNEILEQDVEIGYGGRNSSGEICSMGGALAISSVQSLSRVQLFETP